MCETWNQFTAQEFIVCCSSVSQFIKTIDRRHCYLSNWHFPHSLFVKSWLALAWLAQSLNHHNICFCFIWGCIICQNVLQVPMHVYLSKYWFKFFQFIDLCGPAKTLPPTTPMIIDVFKSIMSFTNTNMPAGSGNPTHGATVCMQNIAIGAQKFWKIMNYCFCIVYSYGQKFWERHKHHIFTKSSASG